MQFLFKYQPKENIWKWKPRQCYEETSQYICCIMNMQVDPAYSYDQPKRKDEKGKDPFQIEINSAFP